MKTKDYLLLEAFKLYVSKPYDQVTFSELELATGLSRGAILYHFKNKELLFNAVIESFVLEESSVSEKIIEKSGNLLEFIKKFISECKQEVQKYRSFGIHNLNLAKFHIEFHALSYYKDIQSVASKWTDDEKEKWLIILTKAVQKEEISNDSDLDVLASMFVNIYQGTAFSGINRPKGYDLTLLEKQFMFLYNRIKRK